MTHAVRHAVSTVGDPSRAGEEEQDAVAPQTVARAREGGTRAMDMPHTSELEGDGGVHQLSSRQLIDASHGARPCKPTQVGFSSHVLQYKCIRICLGGWRGGPYHRIKASGPIIGARLLVQL